MNDRITSLREAHGVYTKYSNHSKLLDFYLNEISESLDISIERLSKKSDEYLDRDDMHEKLDTILDLLQLDGYIDSTGLRMPRRKGISGLTNLLNSLEEVEDPS